VRRRGAPRPPVVRDRASRARERPHRGGVRAAVHAPQPPRPHRRPHGRLEVARSVGDDDGQSGHGRHDRRVRGRGRPRRGLRRAPGHGPGTRGGEVPRLRAMVAVVPTRRRRRREI
jgi:hypothetical protein